MATEKFRKVVAAYEACYAQAFRARVAIRQRFQAIAGHVAEIPAVAATCPARAHALVSQDEETKR